MRFDMAIGKMAPVTEDEILLHLREFAGEVGHFVVVGGMRVQQACAT